MTKLFFLDQHGCAKNQVDGELLITHLAHEGWEKTDCADNASLIIINSCGFIEEAKRESIEAVLAARTSYPNAKIILAGCLAERYGKTFSRELSEADAFFGNGDLSRIGECISALFTNNAPEQGIRPFIKSPQKGVCAGDRKELLSFAGSAYVKITEGCNNCCSFCAIPLIRGQLRSRAIEEIVTEIRNLLARGIFEINLIGQDLASYGKDINDEKTSLATLLEHISQLEGHFWIRLLYMHPDNFSFDILSIMQKDTRILPYFDIPFQHASTKVLHDMNRKGTAALYCDLVKRIRESLSDSTLRTTFLIGFPTENDEDFVSLCDFVKAIRADWAGSFIYSKEEDTKAAEYTISVPTKTAEKRRTQFESIQSFITDEQLTRHIANTYEVLIEEIISDINEDDGEKIFFAVGRAWFQAPEVDGLVVIHYNEHTKHMQDIHSGSVVQCKITRVNQVDLEGILI